MKGWSFYETRYWFRISSRTSVKVFVKKKSVYCLIKVTKELGSVLLYNSVMIGHYDMVWSSTFDSAGYQCATLTPNHSPSNTSLRKLTPCPPLITHLAFVFYKYSCLSCWSFLLVIFLGPEIPGLTLLTSALCGLPSLFQILNLCRK